MNNRRKASLGLSNISANEIEVNSVVMNHELKDRADVNNKTNPQALSKKKPIPVYLDPLLHDALQVLIFSERRNKMTFQTLFLDGLNLLLEKRGLPSVNELSTGEKKLNL